MKRFLLVLICLVLAGCATFNSAKYPNISYSPTKPSLVKIYYDYPFKPFVKIGEVSVKACIFSRWSGLERCLKEEAAQMGGHAIISTEADMLQHSSKVATDSFTELPFLFYKKPFNGIVIRFLRED